MISFSFKDGVKVDPIDINKEDFFIGDVIFGLFQSSPIKIGELPDTQVRGKFYDISDYDKQIQIDRSIIVEIISVAQTKDKMHYQTLGYSGDDYRRLEEIRRHVDVMSCAELSDTFEGNPEWDLRSYIAHTFLEKCRT